MAAAAPDALAQALAEYGTQVAACEGELSLLMRAIRARLEGQDAMAVLLMDAPALSGPGSAEEHLRSGLDGLRAHLVELRDIIAQRSADSIGDECVIC